MIASQLLKIKDPKLVIKIVKCFNFKFKAAEFQFLSETIRIFPLLFRGNDKEEEEE